MTLRFFDTYEVYDLIALQVTGYNFPVTCLSETLRALTSGTNLKASST